MGMKKEIRLGVFHFCFLVKKEHEGVLKPGEREGPNYPKRDMVRFGDGRRS